MKQINIYAVLLLLFLATAVNKVGATTYRLQRVTSVEAGKKYVFEQCGYVMNNTISSNALKTTNSYVTTGLAGTEDYVWEAKTGTSGYKLYSVGAGSYLANASGTNLSFVSNDKAPAWSFAFQADGTAFVTTSTDETRRALSYSSPTLKDYTFKAYETVEWGYQPHSIVVYHLVAEEEGKSRPSLSFDTRFIKFVKGSSFFVPNLTFADDYDGTITYSSSNTKAVQVNPSTGAITVVGSGHALITALASSTSSFDAGEATYTVVVMDGDGSAAKPFSVADFASGYLGSSVALSYVRGYVVGAYDSSRGTLTESASNDNTIYIADVRDGATISVAVPVALTSDVKSTYGLQSHPENLGLLFTAYGNICKNNVCKKTGLDNSSITPATSYPVEVSSARYATYRTSEKLDFTSTGLQPYTVDAGAASIVLQPIEDGVVPAGKAVVVYGEAGTYDVPVTAVDATVSETGLLISDGTSAVGSNVYVLTKKDGEVGFGHWTGATSLSKGKVYITRPASAPEFLSLVIGEPTTVEAVPTTAGSPSADADCYNLQGQRVARPGRGLYIVNGKKMIKR